jgi:hypothetical protein
MKMTEMTATKKAKRKRKKRIVIKNIRLCSSWANRNYAIHAAFANGKPIER